MLNCDAGDTPLAVATLTLTLPNTAGGEMAVIELSELTIKLAAGALPKSTAVAPVNPVPAMVTTVPPVVGPKFGERLVIAGIPNNTCEYAKNKNKVVINVDCRFIIFLLKFI